jgi:hypothetical protein
MRIALIGLALLVAGAAQETGESATAEVQIRPADIKWVDGPPSLPKGAQMALLAGNPAKEGPFVMRIKVPADYKIMPHTHGTAEHITVISGNLFIARSDTFDPSKAKELPAGSFAMMPKGSTHFAFVKADTILQLNSQGPWSITYVNPADDPRNDKK